MTILLSDLFGVTLDSATALAALVILLKITLLLVVALAVTRTMARASAGARHLVWLVVLGGLLLLPGIALLAPLRLPILPAVAVPATAGGSATVMILNGPGVEPDQAVTETAGTSEAGVTLDDAPAGQPHWMLLAWGVVALGILAWLGHGAWSVRRIVRRGRPLAHADWQGPLYEIADRLGLEAAPTLVQSDEVKMPFAAGFLSATIVLPAESEAWSAERRSAVLIHELGHVRRRDLIGHTLGRVACALYWFHPLVWTAARQLRAESERACDDLALVFGARPSDYAEHLLDIVTCVRDHRTPAVALAMAHRKEFEGRMLAILNPDLHRHGPGRLTTASAVLGLAGLAILIGAAAPVPRTSPPPQGAPPATPAAAAPVVVPGTPVPAARPQPVEAPVTPVAESVATRHRQTQRWSAQRAVQSSSRSASESTKATAGAGADGQPDDERAATLARSLKTDSSAEVRRVAAWGLARYARVAVAQEALTAAVTGDADADVREMAAWALAHARGERTVTQALVRAIRQDKDAEVRATAVWAAGSIGDAAALDALVAVLGDPDPDVREVAAWSIGSCRPDRAPAALVSALGDKSSDVRESVAWALYQIRDPDAAAGLDAAFQREPDPAVRQGIIRALAALGERSVPTLEKLVTSEDPDIRAMAVTALAGGNPGGPWPQPRPQPRPFP